MPGYWIKDVGPRYSVSKRRGSESAGVIGRYRGCNVWEAAMWVCQGEGIVGRLNVLVYVMRGVCTQMSIRY